MVEQMEATLTKAELPKPVNQPEVTAARVGNVVVTQHGSLLEAALRSEGEGNGDAPSIPLRSGGLDAPGMSPSTTSTSQPDRAAESHAAQPETHPARKRYGVDNYDDDDDDYDSQDEYDFDRGDEIALASSKDGSVTVGALQPREHALSGMFRKIRVEKYDGPQLSDSVSNKIMSSDKKIAANRIRKTDKSDRATTEQVRAAQRALPQVCWQSARSHPSAPAHCTFPITPLPPTHTTLTHLRFDAHRALDWTPSLRSWTREPG